METSEQLKEIVRQKYSEIADQSREENGTKRRDVRRMRIGCHSER